MSGRASSAPCARGLLQSAAGARARDLSRCRRRVRIALQYLSGTGRGGVGRTPRRAPGEMDGGPRRRVHHGLYGGGRRGARASCLRPQGSHARAGARAHRQYRGAHRLLRSAQQRLPRCAHRLRRADGMGALARRDDQYGADGAVPRSRTTRSHLRDGAAHRHRRETIENRPGGAAPPKSDPARRATPSHGHETSFRQVIADQLGVDPEAINFVSGDSATLASGGGTHSDRSMRLAGALMVETSRKVIDKARAIAAVMLDVAEGDISFADGLFVAPNSNRRLTLFDIARAIDELASLPGDLRAPLAAEASFTGRIPAYPTGAAVCEAEVDPQTGTIEIRRYTSIDDGGQPINPLILHGQVHGGVAQGVGQAMMEAAIYEPGSGQLLSASFLDYALPRADHFPHPAVDLPEHPTKGNALRVKGGGEAGITPRAA